MRDDWQPATLADKAVVEASIQELAGSKARITEHETKRWASITFAGVRHRMTVSFEPGAVADGEDFVTLLPEHDFSLEGWLCADAAVLTIDASPEKFAARIELLLLDDRP